MIRRDGLKWCCLSIWISIIPDNLLEIIDRAGHGTGGGLRGPDLVPDHSVNCHQDFARTSAVPEKFKYMI